jgi:hypothetical protein
MSCGVAHKGKATLKGALAQGALAAGDVVPPARSGGDPEAARGAAGSFLPAAFFGICVVG